MITTAAIMVNKVYIALGSNLGNREQYLKNAIEEIKSIGQVKRQSTVHETAAIGYKDQGKFLNQVIEINTDLSPTQLLISLQEIEHKMGRTREIKNGPRTIDLDILLYNQETINQPHLKIPHPRMHKRKFVLDPLSELISLNELRQNISIS